jgi:hypothetical protein
MWPFKATLTAAFLLRACIGSMNDTHRLHLLPRVAWICLLILAATSANGWQMQQAPLMTRWAALVDTNAPLPEYPRPQMVRSNWMNLNGLWQFQAGATNDAVPTGQTLSGEILVPYPMESAISGVMQYHEFSWYRRTFTVPAGWSGQRIILHLDAVDWQATVYVNGQNVGIHRGGYDPFSYDITPYLNGGVNELIIQVYSPVDAGGQPRGKQTLYPGGIMYTSSSGLWQPAWLEPVDASGVSSLHIVPDVDNSQVRLTVNTYATSGVTVTATVLSNGIAISSATGSPQTELDIPVANANLWSPENPFLYGLQISVMHNGATNDSVTSYFGMRKISLQTVNGVAQMYLNNKAYFEMGPLDQGFWPDGVYTAPTDDALKYDLQQEKALGFNMVRKHIKVERQRWYYWADTLGILVWQDMPSCNSYTGNPTPPNVNSNQFMLELTNMVVNHWNSPAIIMWDTFNESQGQQDTAGGVGQATTASLVQLVKTTDPSRLVDQASGGNYYGAGDVFDSHSYPQPGDPMTTTQAPVDGEYGGIGFQMAGHLWNPALAGGNYVGANTTNDIATIYDTFSDDLVYNKSTSGLNAAVYTQITDVENECNGLMTYDRYLKPNLSLIHGSNQKAITAKMSITTVLPTSQNQGRTWQYTTATPAANWYATNFIAAGWSSGQAGFGTAGTPNAVVRTTWNTSDIWIRQTFTVGALTPADRAKLVFNVYHDEACEIYVNGILAASATGYNGGYILLPMNAAGQNALIANGTNIIAVHCNNTTGGQDIDVGISKENLIVNALVVPTDYLNYWNLDETTGTLANDSAGGDTATVAGATWSSAGKINGCLSFNGLDNYAQVTNTIGGDFSISFWVKTTQAAGTGQWYGGRCLVDGYVAPGFNDFGTSLNGSTFAFGTGNPDMTIASTTAINDGAWHQCVATREQDDGALAIYVDGSLQATGTGGTNLLGAATYLRFGSRQSGANYFNGSLDDIRIYNRVLGSSEVTALYLDSAAPASAPTNLVAIASNGHVSLSWSGVPAMSGYDLLRATNSGGPYTSVAILSDTSYTDSSIANATTYYYVVAAVNSLGDGTDSLPVNVTPSLAASLKTWFKADSLSGLANGAAVSDWPDLSGNGGDATQTNPSRQPVYVTGAMNGLPVVRFNAATSNYLTLTRPVQDDFTIFCLYRSSQGIGTAANFFSGAGLVNGEVAGVTDDFGTSLNASGQILAGTGEPDTTAASATGYNDGQPHEFTFVRTESTGAIALYVDGTLSATATGGTETLTAPGQLILGAQQTLINYLSGDIAEVKIYDSALADSDRISQENKLIYKWGIRAVPSLLPASLSLNMKSFTINWPSTASGWVLYYATNLALPAWFPVTNAVGTNNSQFGVTVPLDSGTRFFRLSVP